MFLTSKLASRFLVKYLNTSDYLSEENIKDLNNL